MSTLGDPLSDAALMCVYRDPAMDLIIDAKAAWTSPLLPTADELAQRYSVASGHPLEHWGFYMALGYFKLAVIAAGIDFRIRMAAADTDAHPEDGEDRVGAAVAPLIASGLAALR
jgi:aminoglycoside phosphotransferase (APT) family kinase protein